MKFFLNIMMLFLLSTVLAPFAFAQNAPADNSANSAPAAAQDDDRLPFMQHENAPESADSAGTGGIILKTFGAMLIIVGLIFFAAWGLKKFGFGSKASSKADAPELAIVSTVTVGSGRTISTVKFGNRVLLVGSTPQSFTLLADGADAFDGEPYPVQPRSVAEMLAAEESFADEFAKADANMVSLFGGRS
jgi:flagellar biosynthetic protein FliO